MLKDFNDTRDISIEPDIRSIRKIDIDGVVYKLPKSVDVDPVKMRNICEGSTYLLKVILEAFFEKMEKGNES